MAPKLLPGLVGSWLAALVTSAAAAPAPMTFGEVFASQRRFDEVRFSPDGRHLLFSELRHGAPTRGMLLQRWPRSTSYVADLDTGRIEEIRNRRLEGVGVVCEPWSADGRFAAVVTGGAGVRVFGYWDQRTHRLAAFGPPPWGIPCGDWLGGLFLYRARLDDAPGPGSGQEDGLKHLGQRWRSAWNTSRAEVTVHSNNPDFPSPSAGKAPDETGLVLADPASGRWSLVARGAFTTVEPGPAGRTFAALQDVGPVLPNPIGGLTGRRGELQVYGFANGRAGLLRTFPELDVSFGAVAWSPDGRRLLAAGRGPGDRDLAAFVVEVGSGAVTRLRMPAGVSLTHQRESNYRAALPLGWVAGEPAFIGRSAQVLHAPTDLRTDRGETQGAAYRLYGFSNGVPVALTGFSNQSVMNFATSSTGEGLVVADGGLWAVAPGRPPRRIGSPDLPITGLAGPGQDRVAVNALDEDGAARLVVLDLATGAQVFSTGADGRRTLSPGLDAAAAVTSEGWSSRLMVTGPRARTVRVANPGWADRPAGAAKHITYKVGGRILDGWVVLPPNYSGGRVPALVWIYGGAMVGPARPPQVATDHGPMPIDNGQLWAAQGYAVIYPSTPVGRGFDSDRAKALADAATAAVDAAAAAGWVDESRAGIMGISFGGYSVAAVLAERSDRFKAGLAMHGVYDAAAAWGARDMAAILADEDDYGFKRDTRTMVEEGQMDLQEVPWRAPEAYRRASPFYQAARIKTPLMLMVGDLDLGLTSLQQTERFYAALVREGNPAVAVRYWGQGHAVEDPAAVRDQWSRASAWFAHYLKPNEVTRP